MMREDRSQVIRVLSTPPTKNRKCIPILSSSALVFVAMSVGACGDVPDEDRVEASSSRALGLSPPVWDYDEVSDPSKDPCPPCGLHHVAGSAYYGIFESTKLRSRGPFRLELHGENVDGATVFTAELAFTNLGILGRFMFFVDIPPEYASHTFFAVVYTQTDASTDDERWIETERVPMSTPSTAW